MWEKLIRASTSVLTIFFSASESSSLVRSIVPIMSWRDCRQDRVKIDTRTGDLKEYNITNHHHKIVIQFLCWKYIYNSHGYVNTCTGTVKVNHWRTNRSFNTLIHRLSQSTSSSLIGFFGSALFPRCIMDAKISIDCAVSLLRALASGHTWEVHW